MIVWFPAVAEVGAAAPAAPPAGGVAAQPAARDTISTQISQVRQPTIRGWLGRLARGATGATLFPDSDAKHRIPA